VDDQTYAGVSARLALARQLEARPEARRRIDDIAALANHRTMFGDDELKWPVAQRFRIGTVLTRGLIAALATELRHTGARLMGRYDVAVALTDGAG